MMKPQVGILGGVLLGMMLWVCPVVAGGADAFAESPGDIAPPPIVEPYGIIIFTVGSDTYFVDDMARIMDVVPQILDGRVYLPVRYVGDAIGAPVAWDPDTQKITLVHRGKTVVLWVGRSDATVDGASVPIDNESQQVMSFVAPPGRVMVPLRFILEHLGYSVTWHPENRMIMIQ